MNKYLKAFLWFLFIWVFGGTFLSLVIALLGLSPLDRISGVVGFVVGIYKAYSVIREAPAK
jgi:uncharacterized membrane protein required for colicin V production